MGEKMSTFIGDSTYTRAPPTYRSPLRSNNNATLHPSIAPAGILTVKPAPAWKKSRNLKERHLM